MSPSSFEGEAAALQRVGLDERGAGVDDSSLDSGFCGRAVKEDQVRPRVEEAVSALRARDAFLLENDVSERAICAKLACYIAPLFPDHSVDVEYNRHGLDPKSLTLPAECNSGGERLVIPDIFIHRRGSDTENLLVIEIKKDTNRDSRACDYAKIHAMKAQFGYAYGVLIELPAGPGMRDRAPSEVWL